MWASGLSRALGAVVLLASLCSSCDPADSDECPAPASTLLLQVGLDRHRGAASAQVARKAQWSGVQQGQRAEARKAIYAESSLWGLDNIAEPGEQLADFQVLRDEHGKCSVAVPKLLRQSALGDWEEVAKEPEMSPFAFNDCPRVFPHGTSTFLDLRLDAEVDGINATGWNPSMVELPDHLKEAFPEGKWLALIRVGHDQCPTGTEAVGRMVSSVVVAASVGPLFWLGVPPDEVDKSGADMALSNIGLVRSWVAVLDSDLRTLARSDVRMLNGENVFDDLAIADARLLRMRNGEVLAGFMPYTWEAVPWYFDAETTWWFKEIVGKLQVSTEPPTGFKGPREERPTAAPQIYAWLDRLSVRNVKECPEKGLSAPGVKKNLGFFEDDAGVHALDWIYPTRQGLLDIEALVPDSTLKEHGPGLNGQGHVDTMCFGYQESAPDLSQNPWQNIRYQDFDGMKGAHLHNGPSLLHIPEAGLYLGVGHFHRGYSGFRDKPGAAKWGRYGHHYSHQFFALNATAPYALLGLSAEFCFESAQKSGDCESIQFVSSLNRDEQKLLVSYGVMDCEAYVARLDLDDILRFLKPVS